MPFSISAASFLLALIGAASGWVLYWMNKNKFNRQIATQVAVAAATKELNDERDFIHLRNNQKDISNGVAFGFKEMDSRLDNIDRELLEIKAWLIRNQNQPDHNQ